MLRSIPYFRSRYSANLLDFSVGICAFVCGLFQIYVVKMSRPWLSVEEDGEGTTVVLVKESHLLDFPKFMKHIIEDKIGLDKGVFKVSCKIPSDCSVGTTRLIYKQINMFEVFSQK